MKKITESKGKIKEHRLNGIQKPLSLYKLNSEYKFYIDSLEKQSILEKIIDFIINGSWRALKILYYIIKIIGLFTMDNNRKTSIWGTIAAILIMLMGILGWNVDAEITSNLPQAMEIIVGLIGTIFANLTNKPDKPDK